MKRLLIGIVFAILTCGIGIYLFQNFSSALEDASCEECVNLYSNQINEITFEELYENQEKFIGKTVRINAVISNDDNYIWILDDSEEKGFSAGYDTLKSSNSCSRAKKKLKRLENGLWGRVKENSIVIGKLENSQENSQSKLTFKILCIEKVL